MVHDFRSLSPALYDRYVAAWGPVAHAVSAVAALPTSRFNVLTFESEPSVLRLATQGLAAARIDDQAPLMCELLLVVDKDFAGVSRRQAVHFMLDLGANFLSRNVKFPLKRPAVLDATFSPWNQASVLLDEPTGESENLLVLEYDGRTADLVWVVPIYASEANLIRARGIEAFDALASSAAYSLADLRRPAFA